MPQMPQQLNLLTDTAINNFKIMTPTKIWLSSPHMGGNEQQYVKEAFETNWVAPLGPNVNGFEKDLELSGLAWI